MSTSSTNSIDRVFIGGVIVIFVAAIAVYALMNSRLGAGGDVAGPADQAVIPGAASPSTVSAAGDVCQCFEQAFRLAGSSVRVTDSQYRTGFEQCRAVYGVKGGDAWTAGWNARLSSRPFEATCRNFLRNYAN